jgi:hypothetical protein
MDCDHDWDCDQQCGLLSFTCKYVDMLCAEPLTDGMPASRNDPVAQAITQETGLDMVSIQTIGSSGWSMQVVYTGSDGTKFFAKTSRKSAKDMFEGEALGLEAMYGACRTSFESSRRAWKLADTSAVQHCCYCASCFAVTAHVNSLRCALLAFRPSLSDGMADLKTAQRPT